jgi:hypothetical protein
MGNPCDSEVTSANAAPGNQRPGRAVKFFVWNFASKLAFLYF